MTTQVIAYSSDDLAGGIVFAIALSPLIVLAHVWKHRVAVRMLNEWARDNRVEVVSRQYRLIRTGPFFWSTGKNQAVFRVAVKGDDGRTVPDWVRCNGWLVASYRNRFDAAFDEGNRQTAPVADANRE